MFQVAGFVYSFFFFFLFSIFFFFSFFLFSFSFLSFFSHNVLAEIFLLGHLPGEYHSDSSTHTIHFPHCANKLRI